MGRGGGSLAAVCLIPRWVVTTQETVGKLRAPEALIDTARRGERPHHEACSGVARWRGGGGGEGGLDIGGMLNAP